MTESKLWMALVLAVSFSLPANAKLYKWVDENGTTHYGETVPPEYAGKDRAELSKTGRVVKQHEVLTADELRAAREAKEQEEARRREEAQANLEQKRRDKALVDTYSSVQEIDLSRQRNLQQMELRIVGINANLKRAEDNLLGLQKEADSYSGANKKVPASLQEDIEEGRARVDKLKKDLEKPLAEKAAIEARYDADRARYQQLTGRR